MATDPKAVFTTKERATIIAVVNDAILSSIIFMLIILAGTWYFAFGIRTNASLAFAVILTIVMTIIGVREYKMLMKP